MSKFYPPYTTTTVRTSNTPAKGELIFDNDLDKLFVGDGITPGGIAIGDASVEIITAAGLSIGQWDSSTTFSSGYDGGDYNNVISKLRLPRITSIERLSSVLLLGELVYDTTLDTIYAGDGITLGGILISGGSSSDNAISYIVAGALG